VGTASPRRSCEIKHGEAGAFEQGEIGPDLFDAACRMGLEGLVSKHRERAYRGGRCNQWIKVKNRAHPAFARVRDQF
jgi:bifunctional non-homologous end joining protein LigD